MERPADPLSLMDWKRRVAGMYAAARAGHGSAEALAAFRDARDHLFASHPETPLAAEHRAAFAGLDHFPHDPQLRVSARLEPADAAVLEIPSSAGEPVRFARVGVVRPAVVGVRITLSVYWLDAYGGGIFLPFRDTLAGVETYGGGRYLLDTVKGADLGATPGGELILDFNYAYNPSCAYDPRWSCPLAPPENRLEIPIAAGERSPAP